ncbi:MAG: hypothetical protein EA353_10520 [Puniceicoccaceae bacterium]|nr:MAG: hypothetical protein EA353_10520 [Puniceicoccaceae bacterium]
MKTLKNIVPREIQYSRRSESGSALITTIIFAMVMSMGLAALINLLMGDWRLGHRMGAHETAFNLAESGVDEAIWAVLEHESHGDWISAGWTESTDGNFYHREWNLSDFTTSDGESFLLSKHRDGSFRVVVEKSTGPVINIVSQGVVSAQSNSRENLEITRFIETQFRRPNPFVYGLVSVSLLNFNGQPYFDSYDSRIFPYDYSFGLNSGDNAAIGSLSTILSFLNLGNSTVKGDLLTGATNDGSDPADKANVSGEVIWGFEMNLPEVVPPNTSGWSTSL